MVTRREAKPDESGRGHRHGLREVAAHLWRSEVHEAAVDRLAPVPGEHVVDIGAGLGAASLAAARRVGSGGSGGSVTAVDPSRLARTAVRLRLLRRPERGVVAIRAGGGESLPLADDSVDAAVALNVAHLFGDVDQVAAELARVLRPEGRVLVVEEDLDDPRHTFHGDTPHHPGGPDLPDLAAALRRAGLTPSEIEADVRGGEPARLLEARRG